jgi:N-acyl-D-aspartate/D-glutamate deacylase
MLDYVIRNGLVVDGTGVSGFRADVGIRDGMIVAVGSVTEEASTELDAEGLVVAPGIIDPHTHYDAQLFWDPTA